MKKLIILLLSFTLAPIASSAAEVVIKGFVKDGNKLSPFKTVGNVSIGSDIQISLKSTEAVSGRLSLLQNGNKTDLGNVDLSADVVSQFPGDGKSINLSKAGEYSFEFNGSGSTASLSVIVDVTENVTSRLGKVMRLGNEKTSFSLGRDFKKFDKYSYGGEAPPDLSKKFSAKTSTRSAGSQIYRLYSDSVVLIVTEDGLGSGVRIGEDKILTNKHVVGDQVEVMVIEKPENFNNNVESGRRMTGQVVRYDEVKDLALVHVNAGLTGRIVKLASDRNVSIAQKAHAIGHPRGEFWTYTEGVVSQIRDGYQWNVGDNKKHEANVIQTQTPINPGNSGGPLFTPFGKLMGINSFGSPSSPGLNFAVAYSSVKEFLASSESVDAPLLEQPKKAQSKPKPEPKPKKKAENNILDTCVKVDLSEFPHVSAVCDRNRNNVIDMFIQEEEWKTKEGLTPVGMVMDDDENDAFERKIVIVPLKDGRHITMVYFDTEETGKWTAIGYDWDNDGTIDEWAEV